MRERLPEKQGQKETINYLDRCEELIEPFITLEDVVSKSSLSIDIGSVLNYDDDSFIRVAKLNSAAAAVLVENVGEVDKALKSQVISENAPWLPMLREKILRFSLYCANADAEMDLKKGKQEIDDEFDRHFGPAPDPAEPTEEK